MSNTHSQITHTLHCAAVYNNNNTNNKNQLNYPLTNNTQDPKDHKRKNEKDMHVRREVRERGWKSALMFYLLHLDPTMSINKINGELLTNLIFLNDSFNSRHFKISIFLLLAPNRTWVNVKKFFENSVYEPKSNTLGILLIGNDSNAKTIWSKRDITTSEI